MPELLLQFLQLLVSDKNVLLTDIKDLLTYWNSVRNSSLLCTAFEMTYTERWQICGELDKVNKDKCRCTKPGYSNTNWITEWGEKKILSHPNSGFHRLEEVDNFSLQNHPGAYWSFQNLAESRPNTTDGVASNTLWPICGRNQSHGETASLVTLNRSQKQRFMRYSVLFRHKTSLYFL